MFNELIQIKVFWFKKFGYLLCLLLFLTFIPGKTNAHDNNIPSELENNIIGLINLIRLDPVTVGQHLGIDTQSLFSDIPSYSPFYTSHKWSLRYNQSLGREAISHCLDMFDRDYFSSVTPEGKDLAQRAADQGYQPIEIYEYMSILSLVNYIQPEKALFELFRQFFLDQAKSYKDFQPNIFDYRIRDIGVSFRSGNLTLGGKLTNVYGLVITYGISKDYLIEDSLARMVNTARNDHVQTLDYFGIDLKGAAKALDGFILSHLNGGLSPIVFYASPGDLQLQKHKTDNSEDSLEFEQPQAKFIWQEHISKETSPWEIARIFFEKLIYMENMEGVKALFNFHANAGVIKLTRIETTQDTELIQLEITLGSVTNAPNLLMGNVFAGDENPDFFMAGTGLNDIRLILYNQKGEAISKFITGPDGAFRLTQEPGFNEWEAWSGEKLLLTGSYTEDHRPFWKDIIIPISFKE
jgi:hypothetical protein